MSVSLWRWSERCEGKPCPGDCDNCDQDEMLDAYEQGFHDGYETALKEAIERIKNAIGE